MTKDDAERMAQEVWIEPTVEIRPDGTRFLKLIHPDFFQRFATLVAAKERAACAQVCEDLIGTRAMARHCADAIRARGD